MPPAMRPPVGDAVVALQRIGFLFLRRDRVARAARATSSTSAWLTRLDLPEPETPVTLVSTPSGKSTSSSSQVVARDAAQLQPAASARAACALAAALSANR